MIGVLIAAMVLWSTKGLLQEAGNILLEGLPRGIRLESVAHSILGGKRRPGGPRHPCLDDRDQYGGACPAMRAFPDMHMDESEKILQEICAKVDKDFHISHITVQFERAGLPQEAGFIMPHPAQASK